MPTQRSQFQTYIDIQRTLKKNKTLALFIVAVAVIFIQDLLGRKQKSNVV